MRTFVLSALLAIALLSIGCAGARRRAGLASRSAAAPAGSYMRDDDDVDEDASNQFDDHAIRDYGLAASAADTRMIAALVGRYYATVAAHDGAGACSVLLPSLAKRADLVEAVPEEYARASGPSALRGKSCAALMSLVFERNRRQLAAESSTLIVLGVRVKGDHGLALLGFKAEPERYIPVQLEAGAWRIDALLDEEIP